LGVAQPVAGELLDAERQPCILKDIDIDCSNRTANNPNAAIGPCRPSRNLDLCGWALCMPVPFRVINPSATLELSRLFGAWANWQDAVAVGDEPRAKARHVR